MKKKVKQVYCTISSEIITKKEILLISNASKYGDVTVGILTDKAIAEYKRIPLIKFEDRFEIISNIKYVKNVIPQSTRDYSNNLKLLKPDYVIHEKNFWKSGIQKNIRKKILFTLKKWQGKLIEINLDRGIKNKNNYEEKLDSIKNLPEFRSSKLRRLIENKKLTRVMEVHSPISALLIEKLSLIKNNKSEEFDAFWSSSLTDSVLRGKPDTESVDNSTRIQTVNEIFEVTTKPLIFDGDTGGKVEHLKYTIRNLERLGVSAIIIEDKVGLKRNSLFGVDVKQKQDSYKNFCNKIKVVKKSQQTDDFMVIARIESLILGNGINDAILRSKKYIKAGADAIMIHSKKKNPNEIKEFCKKYSLIDDRVPLVLVPTSYNSIKEEEMIRLGVKVVIYANHLMRSTIPAMRHTALSILKNQRSFENEKNILSITEILDLIPETRN